MSFEIRRPTREEIRLVLQEANLTRATDRRAYVRMVLDDPTVIWLFNTPLDPIRNEPTSIQYQVVGANSSAQSQALHGNSVHGSTARGEKNNNVGLGLSDILAVGHWVRRCKCGTYFDATKKPGRKKEHCSYRCRDKAQGSRADDMRAVRARRQRDSWRKLAAAIVRHGGRVEGDHCVLKKTRDREYIVAFDPPATARKVLQDRLAAAIVTKWKDATLEGVTTKRQAKKSNA